MSMMTSRRMLSRAAAVLTSLGLAIAVSSIPGPPAHADPRLDLLDGFGSDVTQALGNAWSGFHNTIFYTPLHTTIATGQRQLASWDATPAGQCIVTALSRPAIARPAGSRQGLQLLSGSFSGTPWPPTPSPCGNRNVAGVADFARSDIGPSGPGTSLTYIPYGRDRVSFVAARPGGSPLASLTPAQLTSLYSTGPQSIGGTTVIPCAIPATSTTYLKVFGTAASPGTTLCSSLPGAPLTENDAAGLLAKSASLAAATDPACDGVAGGPAVSCAGAQVVAPFLASAYIARANGVESGSVLGVALGSLAGVAPTIGVAPNLLPNPAFYGAGAPFAFDVYNVVATEPLMPPADQTIVDMFVGPSSSVCAAAALNGRFGFATTPACGATTLTGPFVP